MRYLILSAVAAAAAVAAPPATAQNVVSNGDFEAPIGQPISPRGFATLTGAQLPGWDIASGTSVDIVVPPFAVGDPGTGRALDLNGTARAGVNPQATIRQTLTGLAVGTIYRITFQYVGNSGAAASATVGAGAQLFTGRGSTFQNVGGSFASTAGVNAYTTYVANFIATSDRQTLSFASNNGGNSGIFLDNVAVTAVPESATWAMMIIGFGAVGGAVRRRRAKEGGTVGNKSLALV